MLKIRQYFIILVFSFPFLVSFDSTPSIENSFASFLSPEGIQFNSYSEEWNQKKLEQLYNELLKNKHGKELQELQEINVVGHSLGNSSTKGSYYAFKKSIVLYQGDKYTEPAEYSETLSHEYGHHFAYFYFPSHHLPFSKWQFLRGLDVTEVRWDAFWNYNEEKHSLYPQEIFADDYVLLFGATNEFDTDDVFNNEAFYLRTAHENQELPNVLENEELLIFLEEETGLEIDENRLIQTPELIEWRDSTLQFKITPKSNVAYRLNLEFYNDEAETLELYQITTDDTDKHINFSLDENISHSEYVSANLDVVDLETSIGFETEEIILKK